MMVLTGDKALLLRIIIWREKSTGNKFNSKLIFSHSQPARGKNNGEGKAVNVCVNKSYEEMAKSCRSNEK